MKLSTLLAAISLAATPAFAQTGASPVDGDWIGKGSFRMGADILACTEVRMKFVGTLAIFGRARRVICLRKLQAVLPDE